MKKTIAILLSIFLLFAAFVGCQKAPDPNPASDFEYTVRDDGTIEITKYIGEATQVVIPKKIDGKNVTTIGSASFAESNIVSVVMPNTVKYIYSFAFGGCSNLTTVKMSDSLVSMADGAFKNCTALTDIDLSMKSMKYIDHEVFRGCTNLKTIKFGKNIVFIRERAFFECTSLEEAILPEKLQEIGEYAFMNCTSLQKIRIPKTLEKWGLYPFYGAKSVTEIVFEDGLKQIGGGDGNVISYEAKIQTLRIPASVEQISEGVFVDCKELKEIYFEGACPQIGDKDTDKFVTPVQDVKIYYNPSMPGWDTTPLRNIYTLIPLS